MQRINSEKMMNFKENGSDILITKTIKKKNTTNKTLNKNVTENFNANDMGVSNKMTKVLY